MGAMAFAVLPECRIVPMGRSYSSITVHSDSHSCGAARRR